MNHIYKVIWNHAKHCYTVVSEIAKNHSTSSVTKKKVSIAAILAAGMLSGFSPMVSGAADTIVYDKTETSLKSINSASVGKNAIALGEGASAVKDSIAIGNGAYTQNGTLTKGQSVALGNGAVTGAKSTSIGNNAIGGREGTITIGASAYNEALYSTVVGTDSKITSDGTAYTLDLGFLGKKPVIVQGAVSTSFGAHNTITNTEKIYSGVANSIIGSVNTVTNSNGVTIQGTGNTVTGAYKNMNFSSSDWSKLFFGGDYSVLKEKESGAIAIIGGANTISNQTSSTVIGFRNTLEGKNSTGVLTAGSQNTLTNVSNSLVMGDNNTLKDRNNVISLGNKNTVTANKAVAIGNGTTVEAEGGVAIGESSVAKGNHSTAIGNESNVDGDDGLAIGYKSKIIKGSLRETRDATVLGNQSVIGDGSNNSTIIGAYSNIYGEAYCSTIIGAHSDISEGASGSTAVGEGTRVYKAWGTALGSASTVSAKNGTALGVYSSVFANAKDGVAIGVLSKADRAAGELGYLADPDTTEITWMANKGAVSVGSSAERSLKITRQITNVAAGTYDTDAVNVAQLKKALESIDVDAGTGIKVDKITKDGKTTYKISTNIVGSETTTDKTTVTTNQTNTGNTDTSQGTTESTRTGNTVTVSTETKATSFGADDNKTADVKPGEKLSINGDKKNISTSVNGNSIQVKLNDEIDVNKVTAGTVSVGNTTITTDGLTIKDGPSITKTGIDGGNQKVTGVEAGEISSTSTDAVNGSQLFATNQQVAQNAQSISKLGNRINKVGAGAAALAALHPLDFDPDDKWDFAAGYGNYNGENAAAIGAYYRPNEDTMFSVGGSFGNGENMVNAGVSLKLGQGNHVSTSKVAMAKEIKDLRKEMEGLKSALLDANAGKKLDTSKLQLFPDVPKNHWAYEYVSTLKGNGVLTGYPDGEFKGDRPMTRYEFATMLYKAMLEGATLSDKILKEFAPELERFTVDTVHQDKDGKPTVERVRTVKAEK